MSIQKIKERYFKQINSMDLELLLEFVLNKSKEFILTNPDYKLSTIQQFKLKYFIGQLRKNKPVDYVIGRKEFYGLDFKVNKHTLVPRPETEQIIDLASEIILANQQRNFTFIDLGTGSGNIPIALAKKLSQKTSDTMSIAMYASDISKSALKVAQLNALYHQVGIKFVRGNLLEPFYKLLTTKTTKPVISGCCGNISATCNKLSSQDVQSKILLITANLPYLSEEIYNKTAVKVKKYEPQTALVSGDDGLEHYRKLLQQLKKLKASKNFSFQKTFVLLEISPEQKDLIQKEILKVFSSAEIEIYKDLAQKWRMVVTEIAY
jgi:release factor glutamine methyltransferase